MQQARCTETVRQPHARSLLRGRRPDDDAAPHAKAGLLPIVAEEGVREGAVDLSCRRRVQGIAGAAWLPVQQQPGFEQVVAMAGRWTYSGAG